MSETAAVTVNDSPNLDLEQLRLLAIFHYVVGGLVALIACLPLLHVAVGVAMIAGVLPETNPDTTTGPDAQLAGWIFTAVGAVLSLLGWTLAAVIVWGGRNLARQRGWTAGVVIAGILCLFAPVGTALGIFTILVLTRPSVKERFAEAAS